MGNIEFHSCRMPLIQQHLPFFSLDYFSSFVKNKNAYPVFRNHGAVRLFPILIDSVFFKFQLQCPAADIQYFCGII